MWVISFSICAPWDRGRQEIHEIFRYQLTSRSFDLQVRFKTTTWAKKWGFDGYNKRRFLYMGPIVFTLDRLQPLADKQAWLQIGRWDWGVPDGDAPSALL